MRHLSGGCLCGAVSYSAHAEPALVAVCHCKNCQRQTGTAASVIVGLPAASLEVRGALKTFRDTGDSGKDVYRRFCPECGSPILTEVEVMPGLAFLKAGTLNEMSWLEPTMEIYCDSAQAWVPHMPGAQKFAKGPA